jgi:hypothetical protein
MIFESFPWKMELKRHLLVSQKWSEKAKTERARFYLKRAVFLSAFILRKMMENRKLTDAVRDRSIRCEAFRSFRPVSDSISRFSGTDTDDYDMTKPETITISAFDLMSEIMHSYDPRRFLAGRPAKKSGPPTLPSGQPDQVRAEHECRRVASHRKVTLPV